MSEQVVHSNVEAGIATVTLDSPSNRNALSSRLVGQFAAALASARDDAEVRAIVVTHTGGTFCAGGDLSEALARGLSPEQASAEATGAMIDVLRLMLEIPKPVVVALDGHVRAGGFGLLGAADIVIAGPSSTFALTEVRLGVGPAMISLVLLAKMTPRAVGRYFLTGEKFDVETAARDGLVTVGATSGAEHAEALAAVLNGIRKASPQGLAYAKQISTAAIRADFDANAAARAAESAELFASEEAREGMTAFFGKRKPRWDVSE